MTLLLDTHVILWATYEPHRLSPRIQNLLRSVEAPLFFSSVSIWEIALKRVKPRSDFVADPAEVHETLGVSGAIELPFSSRHALAADRLPRHHTDPFDRALIAQAQVENIEFLTSDKAMNLYADLITLA